ncbi:alpha/beta fold hydrolase [Virgibacillus senegalensis]|uniref:alpha/beta fold hydrolase n=1 Tax=Virgibacillus senegalensis TaxID=1499679 RepID=UPI000AB0A847|nr:alpha/beta hydrolase [Virgibacillus senegalensis]
MPFRNYRGSNYVIKKEGKGKPVIFLPAAGFTGIEGLNIAETLAPSCSTHLLDLPGYGQSAGIMEKCTSKQLADWLKFYLDHQNIQTADLVGHSLGGAIALSFSVHYPERVKQLILLDVGHKPFPRIPFQEFGPFAILFPVLNLGYHIAGRTFLKRLTGVFSDGSQNEKKEEARIEQFCEIVGIDNSKYVREAFQQSPQLTATGLNLLFGYYNLNLPELTKKLTVPTTLLYGTFKNRNEKEYKWTKRGIKKLQKYKELPIEYVPVDSGHYVHWSSDTVLRKISDVLGEPYKVGSL